MSLRYYFLKYRFSLSLSLCVKVFSVLDYSTKLPGSCNCYNNVPFITMTTRRRAGNVLFIVCCCETSPAVVLLEKVRTVRVWEGHVGSPGSLGFDVFHVFGTDTFGAGVTSPPRGGHS